jgi:hypothetical protein
MWLWLATATVDDHLPTTPLPIEWCHRSLPCQIALNRHRRYPMGSFIWTTNLPSSFKWRQSGIQKKLRPTRTQLSDFAIQTVEKPWCSGLPLRLGEIRFILQLLHIRVKFSLRGGGMQAVLPQHFIEVGAVSAGKLGGT